MSTATAEPETTETAKPFRWATYVHVGDGAAECADNGAGCTDPEHFHAWLRVVNPFVRDELRERASAARARRLRQFKDPDSDSSVILDSALDELRAIAERDGSTKQLIDGAVAKDWATRHRNAQLEVSEDERFEHIDADRARFAELAAMSDEERPADEYRELDATITAWGERVEELLTEAEKPLREALEDKTVDELLDIIRQDRIAAHGTEAFIEEWSRQNVLAGTYVVAPGGVRPSTPYFGAQAGRGLETLNPAEADALRSAFWSLEAEFRTTLGNS